MGSLTEEQKSIIIGTLLGDGTLRKKTNTLLEINHSYKQKEYVLWMYEKFQGITKTPPKLRVSGKNRMSCRFTTVSLSEFNYYHKLFYTNRIVKSVPRNLKLDRLSLAVWFMDDGSKSRSSVYFNTQQFNLNDQKTLMKLLNEFGLETSLNKDKKYYRIRIRTSSLNLFKELVAPYMLRSMIYKLPL